MFAKRELKVSSYKGPTIFWASAEIYEPEWFNVNPQKSTKVNQKRIFHFFGQENCAGPVAYAGFRKGGGQKLQKIGDEH